MSWTTAPRRLVLDRAIGPIGILATAWFTWLFVGAWTITPSSVLPVVMEAFGVGEAAAAWIVTAPQIAATITGVPIGMYLDRIDRRRGVLAAAGLILAMGITGSMAAAAGSYWLLITSRVLGGVSLVTIWTAQTAIVTRSFPAHRRATAVGVFVTGYPAGYAFGQFTGPLIAEAFGWTATFGIYAGFGFASGVTFWALGNSADLGSGGKSSPTRAEFGHALSNPGVWGVAILSFTAYMLYMVFNGWMPTYISRTFDISLARSGLYTALFPAIGILSRPGGGLLSERVFGGRSRPVIGISFFVAGTAGAAMAFGTSIAALVAGLIAAGFAIQLQFGLLFTLVQEYVPTNVGGTAVAFVSAIGWLGMFVGPPATGALIESVGTFSPIFVVAIVLAVAGMLVVLVISEPAGIESG